MDGNSDWNRNFTALCYGTFVGHKRNGVPAHALQHFYYRNCMRSSLRHDCSDSHTGAFLSIDGDAADFSDASGDGM